MSAYGTFPHSEPYWNTEQGSSGAGAANPGNIPKAPTSFSALSDSRSGKSNPNWKRQIASGANATTPFTGVLQTLESQPGIYENFYIVAFPIGNPNNWRQTRKTWSHGIQLNMPTLPSISDVAEATSKAQTKFYKDLDRVTTLFQGGVFLGELKETLTMIRNPARSLRRGIDGYLDAAKKRRRGGSTTAKENVLAGLWLEHAFGWAPLLNDLNSARTFLDRKQDQLAQALQPVTGSGTVDKAATINTSNVVGSSTATSELQRIDVTFVRYKGAVKSRCSSQRTIDYDAMGLSSRSFVPTIWELVPWSFAIDYFTNIGDVLTAWANQTVGLSWGCETVRRKRYLFSRNTRFVPSFSFPVWTNRSTSSGWSGASHKRVDRAPITYVPVPSIQFELPGFGKKWLNLAALAASRRALTPF